ncbi:MAG TPA: helix-turn-helix domain-containing protein [Roseiflexaceae bacterium]|jgi:excisionase family DNA binding protein
MKPKIIEQLSIDTILDASLGSADAHSTANGADGEHITGQGKHQLRTATMRDDESEARSLPAADVTALLNLLTDIVTNWQREAAPSSPPEAQALRQVTIRQAAAILGVHERTIRRLVRRGELHAVGRGRLTRIALCDIADYQKHNRR